MILHYLNKKENDQRKIAKIIYKRIIQQISYFTHHEDFKLKDEFNTIFELTCLHLFIIFFSFKDKKDIQQEIMNNFIDDLDFSFRKFGIADMSIGKYVKKYVNKFYFRLKKLDDIFSQKKYDDFIKLFSQIDILVIKDQREEFSHFIYEYILKNIDQSSSQNISEYYYQK